MADGEVYISFYLFVRSFLYLKPLIFPGEGIFQKWLNLDYQISNNIALRFVQQK